MATQAQLLTQVRARLSEADPTYWSEPTLRRWINDVARDIARVTESIRAMDTIDVTADTGTYTFTPSQASVRIHAVEFLPDDSDLIHPLTYRDRHTMSEVWGSYQATNGGYPVFWTSWGAPGITHQIQLYPVPSVDGTLNVYHYRYPEELSTESSTDAAEEVEIPAGWEDALVDGVEAMALRQDRDPRWSEARQLYIEKVTMLSNAALRFTDQAGLVTTASGNLIPSWAYAGDEWNVW